MLAESRKSRGKYERLRAARFEYPCCTLRYVTGGSDIVHLFVLKTHIVSKNGSASFCGCKLKMEKQFCLSLSTWRRKQFRFPKPCGVSYPRDGKYPEYQPRILSLVQFCHNINFLLKSCTPTSMYGIQIDSCIKS